MDLVSYTDPVINWHAPRGPTQSHTHRIEFAASHRPNPSRPPVAVFLESARRRIQSERLIEHPRLNPDDLLGTFLSACRTRLHSC